MGFGVRDEFLLSHLLEQKLNLNNSQTKYQVINAGYMGGFGPDGYYLYLKEAGQSLNPDLIVFAIFVYNDISDLATSNWIGAGALGEPKQIVSSTTQVDAQGYLISKNIPLIYQLPILKNSHSAILVGQFLEKFNQFLKTTSDKIKYKIITPNFPSGEASDVNLTGTHINRCLFGELCQRQTRHLFSDLFTVIKVSQQLIDQETNQRQPQFLVLLIPADFQLYREALADYIPQGIPDNQISLENPQPQKRIKEFLDQEKIAYLDLLPEFRQIKEKLYFATDGHWNKLGHQAAAEILEKWIRRNFVGN